MTRQGRKKAATRRGPYTFGEGFQFRYDASPFGLRIVVNKGTLAFPSTHPPSSSTSSNIVDTNDGLIPPSSRRSFDSLSILTFYSLFCMIPACTNGFDSDRTSDIHAKWELSNHTLIHLIKWNLPGTIYCRMRLELLITALGVCAISSAVPVHQEYPAVPMPTPTKPLIQSASAASHASSSASPSASIAPVGPYSCPQSQHKQCCMSLADASRDAVIKPLGELVPIVGGIQISSAISFQCMSISLRKPFSIYWKNHHYISMSKTNESHRSTYGGKRGTW